MRDIASTGVIATEAKQSRMARVTLDRFVVFAPRNDEVSGL
jgi:hypothetical protein